MKIDVYVMEMYLRCAIVIYGLATVSMLTSLNEFSTAVPLAA